MGEEIKHVTIYINCACVPNPGLGSFGIVLLYGNARKEISSGFRQTTSNRIGVFAAIKALEFLKEPCEVTLHSNSEYLVDTMIFGWAKHWKLNDWPTNKQHRAVNFDLWEKLLTLCEKHQVEFSLTKDCVRNSETEICTNLSHAATVRNDLQIDESYENRSDEVGTRVKITSEGQPCRKCSTPVIKKIPRKKLKHSQSYYFEYYLFCPACHTMYMMEEAKRFVNKNGIGPETGEILSVQDIFNSRQANNNIIDDTKTIVSCSEASRDDRTNALPDNAGRSWSEKEDQALLALFDSNAQVKEIAQRHGRTQRAIAARLVRLGRIKQRADIY